MRCCKPQGTVLNFKKMNKKQKRKKFWNKMTGKALFLYKRGAGDKYKTIYEFCKNRVDLI